MAKLQEMLEKAGGDIRRAERIARDLVMAYGSKYILDLELILSAQGRREEAYEWNKTSIRIDPSNDRAAYNHGWHLIRKGELLEGYKLLRRGRKAGVYAKPNIKTTKPILNGHNVAGAIILFQCESGLGDEIAMVRFVKNLVRKKARVIIACSKSLMNVFSRIDRIAGVVNKDISSEVFHHCWVPSMNSVDILGVDYDTLSGTPYLSANPNYLRKWEELIKEDKFRIGIRWAGNSVYEQELWRTLPVYDLIEVVRRKGVQIYSFQRDDHMIDLPDDVVDLSSKLKTWDDTIAAMKQMDLVISSCTSIPHMAGAVGINTWVIVPTLAYYIWSYGEESYTPWYNTVKVFRQKRFQDWTEPLKEVKEKISCLTW